MDAAVNFPTTPKAVKTVSLKLHKRMSVEQAFEAIASNCLEQVRGNVDGVARFHDRESLHQLRVGVRRLRAALALFDELIHPPDDLTSECAWLMEQLGAARDWDVLVASTLPQAQAALEGLGQAAVLAGLAEAAQRRLDAAYEQAGAALNSLRFQKLMSKLDHWIAQRAWRTDLSGKGKTRLKMRAIDCAAALLEREQQRLLQRGRKLKGASQEQRHRVRIAAKRTRYAAQFFASLFPGRQVRPYVAAVSALQQELGTLNDGAVARGLLGQLAAANPALGEGVALVVGFIAGSAHCAEPRVRRLWRKLAPLDPPS